MPDSETQQDAESKEVIVRAGPVDLEGNLTVPASAGGMVIFAHGSGSSRHSPRNRFVAETLNRLGLGTLLFDLLTRDEELAERHTRHLRFNIELLAERLTGAVDWVRDQSELASRSIGLFGASTGAAAALVTAAGRIEVVRAVVSRGGRPDLAGPFLPKVQAPTLMLVGSRDEQVLELNREAAAQMNCENRIDVVAGASHLFEEPGALERVAELAGGWFRRWLISADQ